MPRACSYLHFVRYTALIPKIILINFDTKINNGKFYYYIHRIKKSGKLFYFWGLIDLVNPTIEGVLSFSKFVQLDSKNCHGKAKFLFL